MITNKPKLRTYVIFKHKFCVENYVKFCFNRRKRSIMAQFRLGILPIKVETGRFRNIQHQDRICDICPNQVEDEIHFLLNCKQYDNDRNKLFNAAIIRNPQFSGLSDDGKLFFLLNDLWKESSNFLANA